MLMSMIWAPFSTWSRATSSAADRSPSLISLRNLAEPVTLVRSPTLTKRMSDVSVNGSSPDSRRRGSISGTWRGAMPSIALAMAAIWSGVVPQQPPRMLTSPLSANSTTSPAMYSGLSS